MVILIGRNKLRCEQAITDIKNDMHDALLTYVIANLSIQSEIRNVAQEIKNTYSTIDLLINNAGTWQSKRTLTADGFETTFATNHLAYFLLTHLLYPEIARAKDGRILLIGSDSHFQTKKIPFDDLTFSKGYHGLKSYALSKLANVMMAYEMDSKKPHNNVMVNCIQPGLVKTDIGIKIRYGCINLPGSLGGVQE